MITATGKIQDGVLFISGRKSFDAEIRTIKNCEVVIEVKKRNKRSNRQNSYLHLLFTIFKDSLNELGNEFRMEEVKELCKAKFLLTDVVNESTGEMIGQRIKGTSELTKIEMMEFIENVIRWGADTFNILLPYPNEQIEML